MTWYECCNLNLYNPPTIFETFVLFLFSIVDLTFLAMFSGEFFPTLSDVFFLPKQTKKVNFNKVVSF